MGCDYLVRNNDTHVIATMVCVFGLLYFSGYHNNYKPLKGQTCSDCADFYDRHPALATYSSSLAQRWACDLLYPYLCRGKSLHFCIPYFDIHFQFLLKNLKIFVCQTAFFALHGRHGSGKREKIDSETDFWNCIYGTSDPFFRPFHGSGTDHWDRLESGSGIRAIKCIFRYLFRIRKQIQNGFRKSVKNAFSKISFEICFFLGGRGGRSLLPIGLLLWFLVNHLITFLVYAFFFYLSSTIWFFAPIFIYFRLNFNYFVI